MDSSIGLIACYDGRSESAFSLMSLLEHGLEKESNCTVFLLVDNYSKSYQNFLSRLESYRSVSKVVSIYVGFFRNPVASIQLYQAVSKEQFEELVFWDKGSQRYLDSFKTIGKVLGSRKMGKVLRKAASVQAAIEGRFDIEGRRNFKNEMAPLASDFDVQRFRSTALDQLQIPIGSTIVLVSAEEVSWQKIKDVVWAIDLVSCVRDDVVLVVLGDFSKRETVKQFSSQANVGEKVFFAGESVDASLDREKFWVSCCDVFVSMVSNDSFSFWRKMAISLNTNLVSEAVDRRVTEMELKKFENEFWGQHESSELRGSLNRSFCSVTFPEGDRAELARCILDQIGSRPNFSSIQQESEF